VGRGTRRLEAELSASEKLSEALFHFSYKDPNEFMRAPTLHTGTATAAMERGSANTHVDGGIYALSKHNLNIDDLELEDHEANLADYMFLKSREFPVSSSVRASVGTGSVRRTFSQREMARAARGYQSLVNNRAFTYNNPLEGGVSILIPSPQFNTHLMNRGLPLTQGQAATTAYRQERRDRHNESPWDYDEGELISDKDGREYFVADLRANNINTARQTWDGPGGKLPEKRFRTPQKQPSLPMDWSSVEPSEYTVDRRGY